MSNNFNLNRFLRKDTKKAEEKILTTTQENMEKEKTMSLSIKEGSFASVAGGFGEGYITPYALSLNANNLQVGLLSSFVGLISPLAQVFGSKLMETYSRKRIIVTFVFSTVSLKSNSPLSLNFQIK